MYQNGRGGPRDYQRAIRAYRKAIDGGVAAAYTNLGVVYFRGFGVAANADEACRLWREGARRGDKDAPGLLKDARCGGR